MAPKAGRGQWRPAGEAKAEAQVWSHGKQGRKGEAVGRKGWTGKGESWGEGKARGMGDWDTHGGQTWAYEEGYGVGYGYGYDQSQWAWSAMPVEQLVHHFWMEYKADDGTPYYYNSQTGLTQWEKPAELEPSKPPEPRQEKPRAVRDTGREEQHPARNDEESRTGDRGPREARRRREEAAKKATSKEGPSEFGPPGCNLFVFHLPDEWTDDDLHEYFAPHGTVISGKVMRERDTGRSRGFGFVSYEDQLSAATAIKKMQGYKILGKRLKVEFKKGEQEANEEAQLEGLGALTEDDAASSKVRYQDDERLIGYLRAISSKNVVQSLKESEGSPEDAEQDDTDQEARDLAVVSGAGSQEADAAT